MVMILWRFSTPLYDSVSYVSDIEYLLSPSQYFGKRSLLACYSRSSFLALNIPIQLYTGALALTTTAQTPRSATLHCMYSILLAL